MTSSAFRLALALSLALLALPLAEWYFAPAERSDVRRISTDNSVPLRNARVAPVRRVMPVTPPLPAAILAAGDVEEPSRAPASAPLPERRDAALADAYRQADTGAAVVGRMARSEQASGASSSTVSD
ncbi:MAG: hypothetical protein ACK4MF_01100 [Hyphomicrobiaceae bacterium]